MTSQDQERTSKAESTACILYTVMPYTRESLLNYPPGPDPITTWKQWYHGTSRVVFSSGP